MAALAVQHSVTMDLHATASMGLLVMRCTSALCAEGLGVSTYSDSSVGMDVAKCNDADAEPTWPSLAVTSSSVAKPAMFGPEWRLDGGKGNCELWGPEADAG